MKSLTQLDCGCLIGRHSLAIVARHSKDVLEPKGKMT